jgi:UDP-glucose 6-dehydrogenase
VEVVEINDYQKSRFVERVIGSMFNTISGKKIAVFGFAFKKDTGDTRETPAIDVCKGLVEDNANVYIYDPKVQPTSIMRVCIVDCPEYIPVISASLFCAIVHCALLPFMSIHI